MLNGTEFISFGNSHPGHPIPGQSPAPAKMAIPGPGPGPGKIVNLPPAPAPAPAKSLIPSPAPAPAPAKFLPRSFHSPDVSTNGKQYNQLLQWP